MDESTRKKIEAAGYWVGDAAEFLGLTEEEQQIVEFRLAVSRAIRERREKLGLTQAKMAAKMKSSQSRVAKIEAAAPGVSIDLMLSGLFAIGGNVSDLAAVISRSPSSGRRKPPRRLQTAGQ